VRVEDFGPARLVLGDAREYLANLNDENVEMIFTDPPYGINVNNWDLAAKREWVLEGGTKAGVTCRPIANDSPEQSRSLVEWLFRDAAMKLVKGGVICSCAPGGGPGTLIADWLKLADSEMLAFEMLIPWDKGPMGMGWRYRRSYEFVMVAGRKGAPLKWYDETGTVENIIRPGDHFIRKIIPREKKMRQHPTEKPWRLAAHFIWLHTQPGELVLDPFMGAGSTGFAALQTGRKFIGIEIDPEWFDMACRKIETEVRLRESGDALMEALLG